MPSMESIKNKQSILLVIGLGLQVLIWKFSKGYFTDSFLLFLFFIFNFLLFLSLGIIPKSFHKEKLSNDLVSNNKLLSTINGIIWEAEADSLNYTYIGGNSRNLFGYTKEECTEVGFWIKNIYPGDREITLQLFRENLKNNKPHTLEYRFYDKNGNLLWLKDIVGVIDKTKRTSFVQGIIFDITEQKKNEKLLQFHSDILNKMSEGVFLLKTDDAKIIYTNPSFDSMFGYEAGELIGKHVSILNSSEIKPNTSIADEINAILYRDGYWSGEVYNRKKNGESFWCAVNVSEYEHAEYGLVWISVHKDISIRKKMETDLINAKKIAEDASKAKTEFLARMSHEIRTPINTILGMVSLLEESRLPAEEKKYANLALKGAELLLDIVNDIFDYSEIEAGKIKLLKINFNIFELGKNIQDIFFRRASEKGIKLIISIDNRIQKNLLGDSDRLGQILINLIGNSIKFTNEGEICLDIQLEQKADEYEELLFIISDTGIGIPKEKQKNLFEGFYQVDSSLTRKYSGTGLGLSICKQLVELMEGNIWIESEEHYGSKFYFKIKFEIGGNINYPTLSPGNEHADQNEATLQVPVVKNKNIRILLVEDDSLTASMMIQILKNKGIQNIKHSQNGLQAVRDFQESEFDLILMDIRMPEMDGMESSRIIREASKIPIVAVTAEVLDGEKEKCLSVGISDYYKKPITARTLVKIINDWT